ncbi:MAG: hypothetical protein WC794_01915 [Candidatus Doudnabacteria bacterium]|jgi:hypothetical protein
MTKVQKIWLSVFLAMFLVPEILWSPAVNFYYQFIKGMYVSNVPVLRMNFLQNQDYIASLKVVYLIQALGLLFALISIFRFKKTNIKWLYISILLILLILNAFILIYAFQTNYSIL